MTMGHIFGFSPGLLPVYFLCSMLIYPIFAQDSPELKMSNTSLGNDATLHCLAHPAAAELVWVFRGQPLNSTDRIKIKTAVSKTETDTKESTLSISKTKTEDHGNYTCVASHNGENSTAVKYLDLTFPATVNATNTNVTVRATKNDPKTSVTLYCVFDIYEKINETKSVEWWHPPSEEARFGNVTPIDDRRINSTYTIDQVNYNDHNGIHECRVFDKVTNKIISGFVNLIVYGDPTIHLDNVIGIGREKLYINWTVDPANSKISKYVLAYLPSNSKAWSLGPTKIETNETSYVLTGLMPNTTYKVKLEVTTDHSNNTSANKPHETLEGTTLLEDPVFVPNISINGFSATSVTIGWHAPPKEVEPYIHYYLLEARKKNGSVPRTAYHSRDSRNLPYMFDNLEPHSTYIFKVKACQDYTKECGQWSEEMEAATLDGIPGKPHNVTINCTATLMFLTWEPPVKPNAEIKGYTMELTGLAQYKDRNGQLKNETWGPLSRFKSNDSVMVRFDDLQPNTNYTVRLSAMTRTRRRGEEEVRHCYTKQAPPDMPPRPRWRKILDKDKYLFKMYLPKVSERNGPICCYRVHVVKLLPNVDMRNLSPQQLTVIDYEEAHGDKPVLGAYVTDIFTNDNFPAESEVVIGDDHSIFNRSDPVLNQWQCSRCLRKPYRPIPDIPAPKVTTTATTTEEDAEGLTEDPSEGNRGRRSPDNVIEYGNNPTMMDGPKVDGERDMIKVKDGPLDSQANYTVFVELIPFTIEGKTVDPLYSDYLNQLMPAPSPVAYTQSSALEIALQATCAIAALVLLIMIIFCIMQTRKSRKLPPHAHLEMSRLPPVFKFLWPTLGRQQPVSATPPDMPPIAKEDLPAAYAERHADSDYGFQKEFELLQMLSECFPDRTTHASEARENQAKNRYPDIKAYDQTRVKLAQIDGITGSDYINANFVMGYKERKRFICAQGPTDTTVNDFWRMVWEHGLELIVMLTNLEEYSKVKCSKYWPDEIRGSKAFGAINVQHVSEKRYSDYIVRELKITKLPTNAEGQPIVENNGVAKRNGDIKQESVEGSAPTSPRSGGETGGAGGGGEARVVRQYHFLMWKDFAAPEHPYSILKFIKRVNEAWANMVGRAVAVHCSAGVGRTGTLVALDCLLEQLSATGHVAVFNTIAELRRQRNFLVQSQKQYVFVYRALVEYAHYGDTEIPASRLKSAIDRLRNTPEGADKCLMEHEFEKMMDTPVAEAIKSCAAGQAEELRNKNRNVECLPYDRNRVMLTPIPGRDYSTYINASFVEAYDNSEGYIITQDPLPNTIFDFWRMVSEQGVTTIVMLSELGEGKCPRYWDDGTAQYEHISVQYDESESCPYYIRRQFRVTNNKTGHTHSVRQLQYQGWPTAPGHVPEVTRGLAELADAASGAAGGGPVAPHLVHCSLGTERSALFVALCILICQLRTERRVDVNAVSRKIRAQRQHTIDTFLQYEFLHRAILNYAELHNLLEDS